MIRTFPISLLMLLLSSLHSPAADSSFRYHKSIERGAAPGEGILAVALDPDVYAATRDGFPDVRILDSSGVKVPFVLEVLSRRTLERDRVICPSELVSLQERPDHGLEIVLKLKDRAPFADGMTVVTPLRDYEHRVRVEGSTGEKDWKPLVERGVIFDLSRYMDLRSNDIPFPRNEARRFVLEISQGLDQLESPLMGLVKETREGSKPRQVESRQLLRRPFRIDRIDLWRTVERQSELRPEMVVYRATVVRVEQDLSEKVTRIEVHSRREPLTGFKLRTTSRNFSRLVRVQVPIKDAIGERWREIGKGTIHRYQLPGFLDEELAVEFAEQRSESYRIVIEDGDSPPIEVTSVDGEGNAYRLTFVASEGVDYRLAYGSDEAQPPRYDAAAVLASLGPSHQAFAVGLGPEIVDQAIPRSGGLKALLNSRAFLVLAMALMILVLAWVLLRAGKQIDKLPGPEA